MNYLQIAVQRFWLNVIDGYVLDASAIIALLRSEPGADLVGERLSASVVCAVNLAEVSTKLADYGMDDVKIRLAVAEFIDICQPFDASRALDAGFLRAKTRNKGLSLGDRACLALARATGRIALTADRAWADLEIGVQVQIIR
jgi:ribonuclease VapC